MIEETRAENAKLREVIADAYKRIDELTWQVSNWERKEIERASCCWENEKQVRDLKAELETLKGTEPCEHCGGRWHGDDAYRMGRESMQEEIDRLTALCWEKERKLREGEKR